MCTVPQPAAHEPAAPRTVIDRLTTTNTVESDKGITISMFLLNNVGGWVLSAIGTSTFVCHHKKNTALQGYILELAAFTANIDGILKNVN